METKEPKMETKEPKMETMEAEVMNACDAESLPLSPDQELEVIRGNINEMIACLNKQINFGVEVHEKFSRIKNRADAISFLQLAHNSIALLSES